MVDTLVSPFFGSGSPLPGGGFIDDLESTIVENSTPWFWSRASSLKRPLDSTSKREPSIVRRLSSIKFNESVSQKATQHDQPWHEIAATVKVEDTKGAQRASKHKRAFKAIVEKWLKMQKNSAENPEILKRNISKKSFLASDDVPTQPPPNISFSILIAEALLYNGEPSLSAKKICKHIMENYKWYKDNQHV